jgi:hAT family C-terminal dimerisation region
MKKVKAVQQKFEHYSESLDSIGDPSKVWWSKTDGILMSYKMVSDDLSLDIVQENISPTEIVQGDDRINNNATVSHEKAYQSHIAKPFLAQLAKAFNERFNMRSPILERLGDLLPRAAVDNHVRPSEFDDVLKFYQTDLPHPSLFPSMYVDWIAYWSAQPFLPDSIELTLEHMSSAVLQARFREIYILLQIYAVVPVTSASGERSFSDLKLIKNRLRSSMAQDRLNWLTLLYRSRNRPIDFKKLANDFLKNSRYARKSFAGRTRETVLVESQCDKGGTGDQSYETEDVADFDLFDDDAELLFAY